MSANGTLPSAAAAPEPTRAWPKRLLVLGVVALGIAGALALRGHRAGARMPTLVAPAGVARLVELGSTSCTSCRAMHEELAHLRTECGASIAVEEIDVWRDEAAGRRYGISVIPTQILFDGNGREIDRHVGFLTRSDIRARFVQRGIVCRR